MMDHPNIARIFDAGATPKGRPYFVMEYIEGVPITQYCDRKRMTIGQRLELFLAVCRAVQHAHQKGVIHRDLKPSNVLVTEQEGAPVPKVIDFGIAKATDQWAVENTLLTQFGQMVGTPEYASPEQADVMTGDVDESSDVYSLGVLLYELLIGTVPFDAARMRQAGLAEMLRIIREEEAPPLSRKLTAMGAARTISPRAARPTRPRCAACGWRPELDHDEGSGKSAGAAILFGGRFGGRYSEISGAPAGAGFAAEPPVPNAQVSSQAQEGGSRHGGRARVHPVERSDGLVACAPRLPAETQAGQTRARLFWRFREYHGRSGIRRNASPGPGGGTRELALPQPASRCAREPDAAADGPAPGYEAHPGCCGRNLRADGKRRGCRGLDYGPWQ